MKSINTGIKFLRLVQIQKGPLKGGFPNSADWKELGVPKAASLVRMDTVQHALAACVKFQNMFICAIINNVAYLSNRFPIYIFPQL